MVRAIPRAAPATVKKLSGTGNRIPSLRTVGCLEENELDSYSYRCKGWWKTKPEQQDDMDIAVVRQYLALIFDKRF
jgi:hypothetical protein